VFHNVQHHHTVMLTRTWPSRPRPGPRTWPSKPRTGPRTEIWSSRTTKDQGQGQHHWHHISQWTRMRQQTWTVNLFTTTSHTHFEIKIPKKENLLRLAN